MKTEMVFETSVSTKAEPHYPADNPKNFFSRRKEFSCTGIHTFSINILNDIEFMPSQVTEVFKLQTSKLPILKVELPRQQDEGSIL